MLSSVTDKVLQEPELELRSGLGKLNSKHGILAASWASKGAEIGQLRYSGDVASMAE